jgi:hypothetical protein
VNWVVDYACVFIARGGRIVAGALADLAGVVPVLGVAWGVVVPPVGAIARDGESAR